MLSQLSVHRGGAVCWQNGSQKEDREHLEKKVLLNAVYRYFQKRLGVFGARTKLIVEIMLDSLTELLYTGKYY